jgi:hypothetical protein
MARQPEPDHIWFRNEIEVIFGDGAQSALARLLALAGDARDHATLLRSISNYAAGRTPLRAEMRALLVVLRTPAEARRLIREAINR